MAKEFAKKFYSSKKWQRTREAYFKYRYGLCERCGEPGEIVHHKIYLSADNINDPQVSLNFDNLELLCRSCHEKEHKKKKLKRYSFDKFGNIIPPGMH